MVGAQYESGMHANRQCNLFKQADAIVFHVACVAFADLPGEVLSSPRRERDCRGDARHILPVRASLWALILPGLSVIWLLK
jgi:hypothetical protein